MNKIAISLLFALLLSFSIALRFSTSFEKMPIGCDEFGYLNLSKAMDEGLTFTNHSPRPYLNELLDTLRSAGITENEISWMVTPHAYHVIPSTNKIINQYPPGTSWLLSLVPFEKRQSAFPLLVSLLMLLPLILLAYRFGIHSLNYFDLLLIFFIFICTVSAPFTTELTRINSVAPTFGLLLCAGFCLFRKPVLSLFLIALSINFRMANLIVLVPFIFYLPFTNLINGHKGDKRNFKPLLWIIVSVLAVLPLIIYNYLLTGNVISTTYSSVDTTTALDNTLFERVSFYFSFSQKWFVFHLICLLGILLLKFFNQLNARQLFILLSFPVVNYTFYIIHSVTMDYYPYASAMILFGGILGAVNIIEIKKQFVLPVKASIAIIGIIILVSGISRYLKKEHGSSDAARQKYIELCDFDIVWADLYSGTTEYVCNNNGFRFGTTTPRARKKAIHFLYNRHYKQAILLNDNTVSENIILEELKATGLPYKITQSNELGKMLILQ